MFTEINVSTLLINVSPTQRSFLATNLMMRDANKLSARSGRKAAQLENTVIKIDIDAQHQRAIR